MTAREYYNRYHNLFFNDLKAQPNGLQPVDCACIHIVCDVYGAVQTVLDAFIKEYTHILNVRNVFNPRDKKLVLHEQNDKWNELCNIFEWKHGFSPLEPNLFLSYHEGGSIFL
jgi:hypothetical protein